MILSIAILSGEETTLVTIKAVGDIMMGTLYPKPVLPPEDGINLFTEVQEHLRNAAILMGNLEGTFTNFDKSTKDTDKKNYFAFKMPISYIAYLKKAGFDILNVANNHSFDFGEIGLMQTINNLKKAGIKSVGIKNQLVILNKKNIKIGILGFYWTDYFNNYKNIRKVKKLVKSSEKKVDILIVTFHGGGEGKASLHTENKDEYYGSSNRGNVIKFAHTAIDHGADLVIGHGPHVPRAMEIYKQKLIAYSLGNFCTYGRFYLGEPNNHSLILDVELDMAGDFISGQIIPVILIDRGIPIYDKDKHSIKLIKELIKIDFPNTTLIINDNGKLSKGR